MNKATSIYLDLVRFGAALLVFTGHANEHRFTNGDLAVLSGFGHDAVVVFFILSGYVIAYISDTKEKSLKTYSINRLARLYSVVFPALILTVIIDYTGQSIDESMYDGWWFQGDQPLFRFFANFLFLNEIWFAHIRAFSNGPFWSLGYEAWYYVLFAVAFYFNGIKKWVGLVITGTFIGPKILILFPIWMLGVYIYHWQKSKKIGIFSGFILFFGSVVLYLLYRGFDGPLIIRAIMEEFYSEHILNTSLRQSQNFLRDYVVGILVAANFLGFAAISDKLSPLLLSIEKPIRFFASYTFSLYLLHYPLLHFYAAVIHNDPGSTKDQVILLSATLLSVFLVGAVTEHKKHLFKLFFRRLLK